MPLFQNNTQNVLQPYLDRVVSELDRNIFSEAVAAVTVKANRAAYIIIWISCAEGIKRKFKELAIRDHKANKIVGKIQSQEARYASVDSMLIEEAKNYGFITDAESIKLNYIYTMRCLYAHPYEQAPKIEDIVSAASDVVNIVLGKQTKLRNGYLSDQVTYLTTDKNFLDNLQSTVQDYADDVFAKTDETLYLWFLQKYWNTINSSISDPTMRIFIHRCEWFSQQFIFKSFSVISSNWDIVVDINKYPLLLSRILSTYNVFPLLAQQSSNMVIGNLADYSSSHPSYLGLLNTLSIAGLLSDRQTEKFNTAIANLPVRQFATSSIDPNFYIDRIIENLKSHDWNIQNPALEVIATIGRDGISLLTPEKQFILGNNVAQCSDGRARSTSALYKSIINSTETNWPIAFIQGLFYECFVNDQNEMRFKNGALKEATSSLLSIPDIDIVNVLNNLLTKLNKASKTYKYNYNEETKASSIVILRDAIQKNSRLQPVQNIIQFLNSTVCPEV